MTDEDGKGVRVVGTMLDISQRKQTETALREATLAAEAGSAPRASSSPT